jgi:gamma-glutamyltranspeptidase / glutathione hydrolase
MSIRAFHRGSTQSGCVYPRVFGARGAVVAENYLAADAGLDVLKAGGNAVDAVVAASWVEGLVDPHMYTPGGEVPMLIKMIGQRTQVINGNTAAPAAATPEAYAQRGLESVPDNGILAAGVPAAPGALITALLRFGTTSFEEVVEAALHYARRGFPMHAGILDQERYGLRDCAAHFIKEWPASAQLYLSGGEAPTLPRTLKNPAYAQLLDYLIAAERTTGGSRTTKLGAVYRAFYQGEPSAAIERFSLARDGLLARSDLERFDTHVEEPAVLKFRGAEVYKCGPWNQGPVLLQALGMLDTVDLHAFGHNSADYIHFITEALNLAFADREQYYGDPRQVSVPLEGLLSPHYARIRAGLIDPSHACAELRPGDPNAGTALLPESERLGGRSWGAGTVHVSAIDKAGNMAAATPSGAWLRSNEVVAELGFPLGTRLMTFHLSPDRHPNVMAPFKRPRTTISPTLVTREGEPWLVFGSMGGDQQDQWQLQFFLNRALFGMDLPEAIEAPKFSTEHFPASFGASERHPRRLRIEPMRSEVFEALRAKGHELDIAAPWSEGFLLAIEAHRGSGLLEAGCDPRGSKTRIFAPATRVY